MKAEFLHFVSTFVAIFVIVDPFALVPVYLLLTERFSPEGAKHTRRKAILVACGILLTFSVTGLTIFNLFGITLPAFQIAGGLLMLLFGIQQLQNNRTRVRQDETDESKAKDDISIFPLGTPLLAGPGAISTVVLMSTQTHSWIRLVTLVLAVVAAMGAAYLVIKSSGLLSRVLGRTGLNLLTRLMGLILTSIAVQVIVNGLRGVLLNFGIIH